MPRATESSNIAKPRTHLLVAHCTTSMQTQASADHKTHCLAQSLGCGCAKGLFPTTTNTQNEKNQKHSTSTTQHYSKTNKKPHPKHLDMVNKEKRTLDEILGTLDEKERQTTQNIRSLIKTIVPETVEIIRRGNLTYILNGKDFVWLTQANGHVDVEFAMGTALDSDLLRDRGIQEKSESVRHIKIQSFEKYRPELTRLLRDAARISLEHYPKPAA